MVATGFNNSWTAGEICPDAWDRSDIQPVQKGCKLAQNYLPLITGPLAKRRGFWRNGPVMNQALQSRLIPFRRNVGDALMLEFGNEQVNVWQPNGSPLINAGVQVSFASPYTTAQLSSLRYKQIGDVIYFTSSLGLQPQSLSRLSNTNWSFAVLSYTNGPWLAQPEPAPGLNVTQTGGTVETYYIPAGATVALNFPGSSVFNAGHVGSAFRILGPNNAINGGAWAPATNYNTVGFPAISDGKMYVTATTGKSGTNPPVHAGGTVSDGGVSWTYVSDGAGIVQITAVTDGENATGNVVAGIPFQSGVQTNEWQESAYSNYRGWPTAWPSMREERFATADTSNNGDMLDLTQTAGFQPGSLDYTPGLGTGAVVDTNAIRVRLGDDGANILWLLNSTYLLAATDTNTYLIAGSVLDEPLSPSTVVVKNLSSFGSADVMPVKAWNGLFYVTLGGQTLRQLVVDTQQTAQTMDRSFLALHIAELGLAQIAWVPQPDYTLWARLATGALAAYVFHQEQNVEGWATQQLGGCFIVEDLVTLPGPGNVETLWMIVSRIKAGVTQRFILMQSEKSDALFFDIAEDYIGEPVAQITGLDHFDGETVRILCNGAQLPDQVVVGGAIQLGANAQLASNTVYVGLPMACKFISLPLDVGGPGGTMGAKQRIVGAFVRLMTAEAMVSVETSEETTTAPERVSPRTAANVPNASAKRTSKTVTLQGSTDYDPCLVVEDDSAYDGRIYTLRPKVQANG